MTDLFAPDLPPHEPVTPPPGPPRERIIDALMLLAGERPWEDISLSDVAVEAGVTLGEFRDSYPSKGAVLAAFSRRIDKKVLDHAGTDLVGEPAKERLFDVLMRRLDAMTPYKGGLEGVYEWVRRDPIGAAALNGVALNAMRFMLEAAGIDSEGPGGAIKLQGLVLAWSRVVRVWFTDFEVGLPATMAALDRELDRGSRFAARLDDLARITEPLGTFMRAIMDRATPTPGRSRTRWTDSGDATVTTTTTTTVVTPDDRLDTLP